MKKYLLVFLLSFLTSVHGSDLSFIAIDEKTNEVISLQGTGHDQRCSACSTFKIALSLIGFDLGILQDENHPEWPYEDYEVFLDAWKGPQTPKTWMDFSVVWYSRLLTKQIGMDRLSAYIKAFDYGNQDLSGDPGKNNGLTHAWLSSSLKISPLEQITFLKKIVRNELPVSAHALTMTKNILLNETLDNGWKIYGKTGSGDIFNEKGKSYLIWYIGWVENETHTYIFALNIKNIDRILTKAERKEMVKGFLAERLFEPQRHGDTEK